MKTINELRDEYLKVFEECEKLYEYNLRKIEKLTNKLMKLIRSTNFKKDVKNVFEMIESIATIITCLRQLVEDLELVLWQSGTKTELLDGFKALKYNINFSKRVRIWEKEVRGTNTS